MSTMTQPRTLNQTQDRCDRCGAEAFVQVELQQGTLLFCGHHFNKNRHKLEEVALVIIDERGHINQKPAPAATVD